MRLPALHCQTEANVSKLRSVPSTRNWFGECGSVRTPACEKGWTRGKRREVSRVPSMRSKPSWQAAETDLGRRRRRGARPDPAKGEEEELLVRVLGEAGQLELLLAVALGRERILPRLPGDTESKVSRVLAACQLTIDVDALAVWPNHVEPGSERAQKSGQGERSNRKTERGTDLEYCFSMHLVFSWKAATVSFDHHCLKRPS